MAAYSGLVACFLCLSVFFSTTVLALPIYLLLSASEPVSMVCRFSHAHALICFCHSCCWYCIWLDGMQTNPMIFVSSVCLFPNRSFTKF
ncbi:hypothetical protein BDV18DRAFT_78681 [Aspergillus unguis]